MANLAKGRRREPLIIWWVDVEVDLSEEAGSYKKTKSAEMWREGKTKQEGESERMQQLRCLPTQPLTAGWKANWGRGAWGYAGFLMLLRCHLHAKCKQVGQLLCTVFLPWPPCAAQGCGQESRFGTVCLCSQCPSETWAWHGGSQKGHQASGLLWQGPELVTWEKACKCLEAA